VASDKQVAVRKKGNVMSSFLVVAALIAAGGVGRFLWQYQARLDHESPAPTPVAAAAADALPDSAATTSTPTQFTQVRPAAAAPAPEPNAAPIPIYAGKPSHRRSVHGDIKIVGKTRTVEAVAPATAEDIAGPDAYAGNPSRITNDAPRIYSPRDPNRDAPPAPTGPGKPRYYDFDSRQSLTDTDDPTFRRRQIVKQY
jgi:hypothetical protein